MMEIACAHLVCLWCEHRVFAGDHGLGDAVRNQPDSTIARVDLREYEIAGIGREHRPLECLVALTGYHFPGELYSDGVPLAKHAIDSHGLVTLNNKIAQR
jgi:hypothetical protein